MKIEEYIHRRRLTVNSVAKELGFSPCRIYRYNTEKVNKVGSAKRIAEAMTKLGKNTETEDIIRNVDCFSILRNESFDEKTPATFIGRVNREHEDGNCCWRCWKLRRCPKAGRKIKNCPKAELYHRVTMREIADKIGIPVNKLKKIRYNRGLEYFISLAAENGMELRVQEDSYGDSVFYQMEKNQNNEQSQID